MCILGKRISAIARTLGMRILIAERKGVHAPQPGAPQTDRNDRTSFEQVLREASVLVICCPRSPETLNMFSAAEFSQMRRCAVIVNVSRGGIVDELALVSAVENRDIFGYATDVFAKEPPANEEDSPLLSERAKQLNITCTPHVAWYTNKTMENYRDALKANVEGWLKGRASNVVV